MAISAKDVMSLREKTGVGVMDCKKALTETDGDMEKAIELLREKGKATSEKRAGKIASQGIVDAYVNGNVGVIVEVNCESDFVARGDQYKEYVATVAKYIAENEVSVGVVSSEEDVKKVSDALHDVTMDAVAKIGEKIAIRRFIKYVADDSAISSYIHMGGAIGVLVETKGASDEIAHDIALQIAAAAPSYVCKEEVPAEVVAKEKEIMLAQAMNDPKNAKKPQNILEKMIEGKVGKFYKEICLVEQEFIRDTSITISALLKDAKVVRFTRFVMGEGLEKKVEDLSKEVEEQIAKAKKQ